MTDIYVDPTETDEVILVGGVCYYKVGPSDHPVTIGPGQIVAGYGDCTTCLNCPPFTGTVSWIDNWSVGAPSTGTAGPPWPTGGSKGLAPCDACWDGLAEMDPCYAQEVTNSVGETCIVSVFWYEGQWIIRVGVQPGDGGEYIYFVNASTGTPNGVGCDCPHLYPFTFFVTL